MMTGQPQVPTMDEVLRDSAQVRRRILHMLDQRFLADTVVPFQRRSRPVHRTRRQRLAVWLSGWSVTVRERLALRLAPWLDRGEEL